MPNWKPFLELKILSENSTANTCHPCGFSCSTAYSAKDISSLTQEVSQSGDFQVKKFNQKSLNQVNVPVASIWYCLVH